MTSTQVPESFQLINGIHAPRYFDADKFRSGLDYKVQPDDIFIVTYPKSGTTWMEVIVFGLINNGKAFDEDIGDYLTRTPYLERVGAHKVSTVPRPCSIKTHVPFEHIPYHPQAKYICIVRNPKDVCVSLYQFWVKHAQSYYFECQFDRFFTDFMKGQLPYGDYFQYLRSLMPYKEHANVLIISYEQMKRDIHSVIRRVAEFININLNNQGELLDRVVTFSSFEYMKNNFDKARNNYGTQIMDDTITPKIQLTLVRKGTVGDWKSCMSDEQNEQFDKEIAEKMRDMPELEALWQ
jgi:hypothetical protein